MDLLTPKERAKAELEERQGITVGELREHLRVFDSDARVIFSQTEAGNRQVFSRTKSRGEKLVGIELWEVTDHYLAQSLIEGAHGILASAAWRYRGQHRRLPDPADREEMMMFFRSLRDDELEWIVDAIRYSEPVDE